MGKEKIPQPTGRELEILSILWNRGPSTVRDVNEQMNKAKATGYTTTLKLMQIMADKCLLIRDDSCHRHVYKPAVSQEKAQKRLVGDLIDKAFSGSAEKLVMRALSAKKVSPKELAGIRRLLDKFEGR